MSVHFENVETSSRQEIFENLEAYLMRLGVQLADVRATLPLPICQWLLRTAPARHGIWAAPGTVRGLPGGVVVRLASGDLIIDVQRDVDPDDHYCAHFMEVFVKGELAVRLQLRCEAPR